MCVPRLVIGIIPITLLLAGCFGTKQDVQEYVDRAISYEAAGDLAKASSELRTALKIKPLHAQANALLGQIEDGQGDLQAAVNHYIIASRTDALLLQPQLRLIELMIDANELQTAAAKVNATLGTFPGNIDALSLRADIAQKQGKSAAVQSDLAAVLAKDPTNARATTVAATSRLISSDLVGASKLVERGLTAHPSSVKLLEVKAAIALAESNPGRAVEALAAIIREEPKNVLAHSVLANAEAQAGRYQSGLDHLREAAAADPASQPMQAALVNFLVQRGQPADVVAQLDELIKRNATASVYDRNLAEYYRSRGEPAEAERVLSRAVARLGDSAAGRDTGVALAKAEILSGRLGAARQRLDMILRADPNHVDGLMTSAILFGQNGRLGNAIESLLTVVKISPTNGQAFQLLASDYMATGQPELAVSAMQRAAAVAPGDVDLQIRLAAMMQAAGRSNSQAELLTRLTLQTPQLPGPWLATGELAIERKDFPTAERALARLRTLPDTAGVAARFAGDLQSAKGNYPDAVNSYEVALQEVGKVDNALLGAYVEAATKSKRAEEAANLLEKLTKGRADNPMTLWIAAMDLWANAGAMDKAKSAFTHAVDSSSGEITPYEAYAGVLVRYKLFEQAQTVVKQGTGKVPDWSLLVLQGTVAEQQGDMAVAASLYKQAADLNPSNARADNNYASLLADLSPKDKPALEAARAKLSGLETSSDTSVVDTIAWLDFRLGHFDQSRQLLTQINAGSSDNPQIRFHMAAVLLALGEKKDGLALLDTVKGLIFPGSNEIKDLSAT